MLCFCKSVVLRASELYFLWICSLPSLQQGQHFYCFKNKCWMGKCCERHSLWVKSRCAYSLSFVVADFGEWAYKRPLKQNSPCVYSLDLRGCNHLLKSACMQTEQNAQKNVIGFSRVRLGATQQVAFKNCFKQHVPYLGSSLLLSVLYLVIPGTGQLLLALPSLLLTQGFYFVVFFFFLRPKREDKMVGEGRFGRYSSMLCQPLTTQVKM